MVDDKKPRGGKKLLSSSTVIAALVSLILGLGLGWGIKPEPIIVVPDVVIKQDMATKAISSSLTSIDTKMDSLNTNFEDWKSNETSKGVK